MILSLKPITTQCIGPIKPKANTSPVRVNHIRDRIVRDFGKHGMNSTVMAERYGSTPNSVKVTIHKLRKEGRLPWSSGCGNGQA